MSFKTAFNRHRKVFSQFSFREKIVLLAGLTLQRLQELLPGYEKYRNRKLYFDDQFIRGNEVSPAGEDNILTIKNDPELGVYRVLLRKYGSDYLVLEQVMMRREYEALQQLVQQAADPQSVQYVIDAGGNIGLTTLFLKKKFPQATVLTLEPFEANYLILKKNIALNDLQHVYPLQVGLWHKSEPLVFDTTFRDGLDWGIAVKGAPAAQAGDIPGKTISELLREYAFPRIDILKIDVEGAERFIFEDDGQVDDFLARVRFLAIEIHDEFGIRPKIYAQLKRNGFEWRESEELTLAVNRRFQFDETGSPEHAGKPAAFRNARPEPASAGGTERAPEVNGIL